ncbi:MAG TPA: multicopper oxidase domain-containing protein [Chitinophagaceae bacterium]|nr:multicopper oxidase domain-containing protein [Chitinophagaceae bacterium]
MKKSFVQIAAVLSCLINISLFAQTIEKKIAGENVKPPSGYQGKRVQYDLNIADTMVNYTGKYRMAIAVNGSIPAPTLYFTEGDTAIIRVHNRMKHETSVHWHGILLPNPEDGVPYLTTAPIKPGTVHTFTFPIIQSGTFWYHSHTMLQEQSGLYGSIVIKRPDERAMKELVLVLSDWTDENPHQVHRYLKKGAEWYSIKKGAMQSYGEAIAAGYFKDKLKQEWMRMTPMDVADVYYNAFLINGKDRSFYKDAKPGEIIKLRIINGSASTYFTVQFAGGQMQVASADGINVMPLMVDKIELATAETYDVLIQMPEDSSAYEFRATSWDITGYGSIVLGNGDEVKAPTLPKLDYFAMMREMNTMMGNMNMSGGGMNMGNMKGMKGMNMGGNDMKGMDMNDKKGMDMQGMNMKNSKDTAKGMKGMDMNNMNGMDMKSGSGMSGMSMPGMGGGEMILSYDMLRSINPSALDPTKKWREINLTLTGNMLRYVWSFDNKTLSESDNILIRHGENVRMILMNTTMMRHPMHLHGHFFRVVNAQGEYSPMKHTFDIKPMETVTIEFYANEEKDWFFHCHNLYHMMSGMARVVSYEGSERNEFARTGYKILKKEDRKLFPWMDLSVHSQGVFGMFNISNNKYALETELRSTYKGDVEVENHLLRYLDKQQYLAAFVGYDYRRNKNQEKFAEPDSKDNRHVFDAGIYYLLPMLVRSEWRVDNNGNLRLQLERRDLALSNNFFADLRVNTDKEYTVGFRYMFSRYFSISANYDSDYKWGAGLTWHY